MTSTLICWVVSAADLPDKWDKNARYFRRKPSRKYTQGMCIYAINYTYKIIFPDMFETKIPDTSPEYIIFLRVYIIIYKYNRFKKKQQ